MEAISAVIPMRRGSKGLPGKNLACLGGKPLWKHTLNHAIQAGFVHIVIDTDIPEIIEFDFSQLNLLANVQAVNRPPTLASDTTTTIDTISDLLRVRVPLKGTIVLLQVTSPLRDYRDINRCVDYFSRRNYDTVLSICQEDNSCLKNIVEIDDVLKPIVNVASMFSPRQCLPRVFKSTGSIYVFDAQRFLDLGGFGDDLGYVVCSKESSVDIDSQADLDFCEAYLKAV